MFWGRFYPQHSVSKFKIVSMKQLIIYDTFYNVIWAYHVDYAENRLFYSLLLIHFVCLVVQNLKFYLDRSAKRTRGGLLRGGGEKGGGGGGNKCLYLSTPAPRKTNLDHSQKEVRVLEQVLLIGWRRFQTIVLITIFKQPTQKGRAVHAWKED